MHRPADRDRLHVRLMAQHGNRHFRLIAHFLDVKGEGGVVNRGVAGRGSVLQIEHEIPVGVGEGTGQRHLHGVAVDLQRDDFIIVALARIVLPDQISLGIAAEDSLVVVANEEAGDWFWNGERCGHGVRQVVWFETVLAEGDRCCLTSPSKNRVTARSGTGTDRPKPQIDASSIALLKSFIIGSSSFFQRSASMLPASRCVPSEAIFCDPSRHGTHLPHDSLR